MPQHYNAATDLRVESTATPARDEALLDLAGLRQERAHAQDKVEAAKDVVRAATQLADAARWPGAKARTQQNLGRAIEKLDAAKRILNQAKVCFDHLAERLHAAPDLSR